MADGQRVMTDQETGDVLLFDDDGTSEGVGRTGAHFDNLASKDAEGRDLISQNNLDTLSSTITELVSWDEDARGPFLKLLAENLKLLGVGEESQPDDTEYEHSDTSDHTLMLTALLRFQSKALSAMLPSPDRVCRTEPALDLEAIDDLDERNRVREITDAAGRRVERFMADYLLKKHKTYRQDTDLILQSTGENGVGIRKIWNDFSRRNMKTRVDRVPIDKLIFSYDSGRMTEIIDMPTPDLIRNIRNGTYANVTAMAGGSEDISVLEMAENEMVGLGDSRREGETHRLYEIHMDLFLDEDPHPDGLARPYIVTIHAASQTILSMRRNWAPNDPDETPIERYVAYVFLPAKNAYTAMGLGHILASTTRALRKAQRRGLEAGYLQNHPSGFKASSLKIRNSTQKIMPGEFMDVDTPTGDISRAIMLHPFAGPSAGLMALSDKIESNGKELGGVATIDFASLMKAGMAAGPAMAAYDESTEFQTAIHLRLYHAHAMELRLIMDRMREVYGQDPVPFGVNSVLMPGDLTMVDLVPVMKPGQISRQRTILEAQAMLEIAEKNPDMVDKRRALEDYIHALGKADASEYLLPDPAEAEPPVPMDPVSEYNMVLAGQPIMAGAAQDHAAHIEAHAAQMRIIQGSQLPVEMGQKAIAELSAHIAQHMGMQLMAQVAARAGIPFEVFSQMTPDNEAQLAPIISEQVQIFEEENRPEEPQQQEESKVLLEQIKTQGDMAKQDLKHRHDIELAELKSRHQRELQAQKDDAAMDRAIQDDDTAMQIAREKGAGGSAKAGVVSS